ncbi:branched-chain amino acid transport system II carrier protein [Sporosarcina sp. D27]|uniref:branched-chain amino acid transport system II carrier protein n=1 Tax=Sporosarcina sp. D27 TaxID=1382305 RepID=UPI0004726A10|nr:branched-chain amino acid transport system II carrier protein [Sporosarcina sp. D27]
MSRRVSHIFILGFALFALYFGAGNLIFPPSIGLESGSEWISSLLGFSITGIVLPLLAVFAILQADGKFENLTKPISPWFYAVFNLLLMVGIGVFVTIPRMAATTHELGVGALFPGVPSIVTIIVFFVITFFFAKDASNVIDRIGRYLTPVMVALLLFIVGKGIFSPLGTPTDTGITQAFSKAFVNAYQTGDVITGILCAPIFILAIRHYGYIGKEAKNIAVKSIVIAAMGLLIVYGGLLYISAGATSLFPEKIESTMLVKELISRLLGGGGAVALAIVIALACLTSTIGVVAVIAEFLKKLVRERIGYTAWVAIICTISASVATLGVERIVDYTMWIFTLLYPIAIVLVMLGIFHKSISSAGIYRGAILMTFIVSALETLAGFGIGKDFILTTLGYLPLGTSGFAWLVPAIVGGIVGYGLDRFFGVKKQGFSQAIMDESSPESGN